MEDISNVYTTFLVVVEKVELDFSEVHSDISCEVHRHKLQLGMFYLALTSNFFM